MPTNYQMQGHYHDAAGHNVMSHVHMFLTNAEVADGHQHVIVGTTGPEIPSKGSHIHKICLRTSFDPKGCEFHWHKVNVMTGPTLDTPDGKHTHFYCGETSCDLGHSHAFSSLTDTSLETGGEYAE